MASDFAELIELRRGDNDRWIAAIPEGWDFMGIPNGGLISAIMATALVRVTGRPDPITSTAHFVRPAYPGPATLRTEIIRSGRILTTARAEMSQNDKVVAHLVGSFGDLTEKEGEPLLDLKLPPMPPPEKCLGTDAQTNFEPPPIAHRLNLRVHPDQISFASGEPSGVAVISGWADIPFAASTALIPLVADALPPSLFNAGPYLGMIPTIELTVHTHARPAPGPVAGRFRTDHAGPRLVEEDGWVSDITGKLVAVSRQLAVMPD